MDKVISEERIALFCDRLAATNASPNTLKKYSRDLRKLQGFLHGRELTQELLEDYRTWLLEGRRFKESSVNSYLIVANRFCEEMGWKMHCYCVKPSASQKEAAPKSQGQLSYVEYVCLVQTALAQGMYRLAMLVQILGNTDLRVGEISCIRIEHLADGIVPVMRKGKKQYVILPAQLLTALRQYAEHEHITAGMLFRTVNGAPVDRSNLWREMQRLGKLAGIEEGKLSARGLKQPFAAEVFLMEREN